MTIPLNSTSSTTLANIGASSRYSVVNHGVSSELIERFKVESRELFEMPIEEKIKYWQKAEDMEGFGQNFVVSEEQKLDWGDSFFITLFPLHLRRPHLLPLLPLPFRETLESYAAELKQLAMKIFDCIAKHLKTDPEYLRVLSEQGIAPFGDSLVVLA